MQETRYGNCEEKNKGQWKKVTRKYIDYNTEQLSIFKNSVKSLFGNVFLNKITVCYAW